MHKNTIFEISEKSLDVNGLTIAYTDVGPRDGRVLLCVHGLLSNGRDYDFLALHMAHHGYRVLSVDLPGRGKSDRFPDPALYTVASYFPYVLSVIATEIGERPFDWLGVSLGGMIAMACHAMDGVNLSRMILVDIGAEISGDALDYVSAFAKTPIDFTNKEDAISFLKKRCGAWGIMDEDIWNHLIAHNIVSIGDGHFTMHYDPEIGEALADHNETIEFWDLWKLVKQDVLIIRGEKSKLLPASVSQKMVDLYQGAGIEEIAFKACGHVPNLMQEDHIAAVTRWLTQRV